LLYYFSFQKLFISENALNYKNISFNN